MAIYMGSIYHSEVYLEPKKTSEMEFFLKMDKLILQKVLSEMFYRLLNTPLLFVSKL